MSTSAGSESLTIEPKDAPPPAPSSLLADAPPPPITLPPPEAIASKLEALLFSVDRPLSAARLAECLDLAPDSDAPLADIDIDTAPAPTTSKKPKKPRATSRGPSPTALIKSAIDLLNTHYADSSRAFRIELLAGGYRVMTLPAFAPVLERYHGKRDRSTLSRAALESLAIVAYKQPVTRAGLESIRGVACGEVLRSLMERRLVTIVGRAEDLGRPMLYGTTRQFLEVFGLSAIKDLPTVEEFRSKIGSLPDDDE